MKHGDGVSRVADDRRGAGRPRNSTIHLDPMFWHVLVS